MEKSDLYQLYKPQLEDVIILKLKIGRSEKPLESEYCVNASISINEWPVKGKKTTYTSIEQNLNEYLTFHCEKFPTNGMINFEFELKKKKKNENDQSIMITAKHTLQDLIGTSTIKFTNLLRRNSIDVPLTKIEIEYEPKTDVRIRHRLSLCEKEENFCKKRKDIVKDKLSVFLGRDELKTVPNIAIIGSGGGMRAVVGMCGAMLALKDLGILDCAMYIAGVSGSAWYVSTLYKNENGVDPKESNDYIQKRLETAPNSIESLVLSMCTTVAKQISHGKHWSIADAFGRLVGDILLGEDDNSKWSDQRQKLQNAEVPLPLLAAVRVRDKDTKITEFHEWMEFSPFEAFMPKFGTGIDMKHFGSKFNRGFLTEECAEQPVYVLQGVCGSAYAKLLDYITTVDENDQTWSGCMRRYLNGLVRNFEKLGLGEVPNWLYGIEFESLFKKETKLPKLMTTTVEKTAQTMVLTDAGTVFNSPYPLVLHPDRDVDIILSFDFSYELLSKKCSGYKELQKAEQWAKTRGLPFPDLNINDDSKIEEARVFYSRGAPVIIHFPMINDEFKTYSEPKVCRESGDESGKFNILPEFDLSKFQYSKEEFDRLSKLMEFNVKNNEKKIRDGIELAMTKQN